MRPAPPSSVPPAQPGYRAAAAAAAAAAAEAAAARIAELEAAAAGAEAAAATAATAAAAAAVAEERVAAGGRVKELMSQVFFELERRVGEMRPHPQALAAAGSDALPRAEVLACARQVIKEATLQLLSEAAK